MPWCCFRRCTGGTHDFDVAGQPPQVQQNAVAVTLAQASLQDEFSEKQSFFVITAIFNPASYKSRYDLYHKFARHMEKCGAQLITIECIFPSLNQTEFHVTSPQNPYHIQLKSESVYWVKESLINAAANRLPPHAKYVCWLDADIQFHDADWIEKTIAQLKQYSIVQMFEKAAFLGPKGEALRTDYSFGYSVVHGKPIDQARYDEWYPHSGYGWAASLKTFQNIGGLPDYDILGSGDLHFAFSLLDRVTNALESDLNPDFKNLILQRSKSTYNRLAELSRYESKRMIGYVPITISHNWHGSRKHRQYVDRWKILIAHNFNFSRDTVKTSDGLLQFVTWNAWRKSNDGKSKTLQEDIIAYFQMRNEDDVEYEPEDNLVTKKKKKKLKKKRRPKIKSKYFVGDIGFDDGDGGGPPSDESSDSAPGEGSSLSSGHNSNRPSDDDGDPGHDSDAPGSPERGSGDEGPGAEILPIDAGQGDFVDAGIVGGYENDYGGSIQTTSQY